MMIAVMGAMWFSMIVAGHVVQGHTGVVVAGIVCLLVAAPAIATPFSVRIAKRLLATSLACLAAGVLWLVFWPHAAATPSPLVKVAVVAFAALLLVRLFLARRRST